MLRLFKKKEVVPVHAVYEDYLSILNKISQYLLQSNNVAQGKFVATLMDLLRNKDVVQFVKLINGVDMWGGAGAVWEAYIENEEKQRKFEKEMLLLIELMKRTNIMGSGAKSIEKIFKKNIKSS